MMGSTGSTGDVAPAGWTSQLPTPFPPAVPAETLPAAAVDQPEVDTDNTKASKHSSRTPDSTAFYRHLKHNQDDAEAYKQCKNQQAKKKFREEWAEKFRADRTIHTKEV